MLDRLTIGFRRPVWILAILILLAILSQSSCTKKDKYGVPTGSTGLKPGLNFMQPNKWELSYRYRVKQIVPTRILRDTNPSAFDPLTKVVGPGTYEIWFAGPMESDEVHDVKLIAADPPPTRTEYNEKEGITFLYYDVAPDNRLPEQFMVNVTWSFYTLERYTYWEGMENLIKPYDKDSELYKQYTVEEYPIEFHAGIVKDARECVEKNDPDNIKQTALNMYNKIVTEYMYDWKHTYMVALGEDGLIPTSRVWLNKRGVCDEFANMFVSMARSQGIPARACAGISHQPKENAGTDEEEEKNKGSLITPRYIGLKLGFHSWAEFYIEGVGWIPVDATWASGGSEPFSDALSPMGSRRKMTWVEYYFGKMDPFRITMFKGWNYELLPKPRTPDAQPTQPWMMFSTVRYSGVKDMVRGFDDTYNMTKEQLQNLQENSGTELGSTVYWDSKNVDFKLVHIADPPAAEVDAVIKEVTDAGYNYLAVPTIPWKNRREQMNAATW